MLADLIIISLSCSIDNIAQQAQEHIHSNEIILTLGTSHVVESFLRKAAAHRKFDVIVVECEPLGKVGFSWTDF